ncbi:MAG: choline dehydrogenase [Deltaproteobacteria bacterium]|nr:MAG: choline dehydrogenase [Deltaproteobacteria bacterium]
MRWVIIGAGAAGCVAAERLSRSGEHEVLLVEAGPDRGDDLPRDLRDGHRNSYKAHDWGLSHRPNPRQVVFPMPRGKVVGGSSAVNTCIAMRGEPADFDEWGELGLDEWSWEQCLPAFKAIERDEDFGDHPAHGKDGPLPITRIKRLNGWQAGFLEACSQRGYGRVDDLNAPGVFGAGVIPRNVVHGERISAASAWLTPDVRARENLTLVPNTMAVQLRFEGRRVTGVEVRQGAGMKLVPADRVVCALGAVLTPGLLQRSGIGPRAVLEDQGVAVVHDSPGVGARLLDHAGAAMFCVPWTGAGVREGAVIETMLVLPDERTGRRVVQLQPGSFLMTPYADLPFVTLMLSNAKPKGHGTIRYDLRDFTAPPQVDSRLLVEPEDQDVAARALVELFHLSQTAALSRLGRPLLPLRRHLETVEGARRILHRISDSGYHMSGTVPMGPSPEDPLDGRGRVRGVDGVYVWDASVFPTIPSNNIHLPVLMCAHRFAEWAATED